MKKIISTYKRKTKHTFVLLIVVFILFLAATRDKKLPQMLVIGDSISFQYRPVLQDSLAGIVNLKWLGKAEKKKINGGDSKRPTILKKATFIENWLASGNGKWDIISFNYGLHDLKFGTYKSPIDPDKFKQYCSPLEYKMNLRYIIERLRKTGARLIWVTVTPGKGENGTGTRIPGDHEIYNSYAAEVLKDYPEIMIVDLYRSNMAHLDQQDVVHFAKPEGKQRAASLISKAVKIILEQKSAGKKIKKEHFEKTKKGEITSKIQQVYNNGVWKNIWKTEYLYKKNNLAETVGAYFKNNKWGNAYRFINEYSKSGVITKKMHQLWRNGKWTEYKKECYKLDAEDNTIEKICYEWNGKIWENAWKYVYTYDNNNTVLTTNSFIFINNEWQKNLEQKNINSSGRKIEQEYWAKLGDEFTIRYKLKYKYDAKGRVTNLYTERHCLGKWNKSTELRTNYASEGFATVLDGYFQGKPIWTNLYKISGIYDENGNIIQTQYRNRVIGIAPSNLPVYEDNMKYNADGKLTEKLVKIPIGDQPTKTWTMSPSCKIIYNYTQPK
jgi:acyl-CoA thioesterase-1